MVMRYARRDVGIKNFPPKVWIWTQSVYALVLNLVHAQTFNHGVILDGPPVWGAWALGSRLLILVARLSQSSGRDGLAMSRHSHRQRCFFRNTLHEHSSTKLLCWTDVARRGVFRSRKAFTDVFLKRIVSYSSFFLSLQEFKIVNFRGKQCFF